MGGLPQKIKKPTHFTKKEILKHLSLEDKDFRKLIIFSGIYVKWPNHRRYKGRRDKTYYSKADIRYLRNSTYYKYLKSSNKFSKKLKKLQGREQSLELKSLSSNPPKVPALEMIEAKYKDFKDLLLDLGESVSNVALIVSNFTTFKLLLASHKNLSSFIQNNKLEEIKLFFLSFLEFLQKNSLIEKILLANNYAVISLYMLNQRILIRLPYCNINKEIGDKLPSNNEIKVDLTLFEDLGLYSYKLIDYTLKYIEHNNIQIETDKNKNTEIFKGIKALFITKRFDKNLIELMAKSFGIKSIEIFYLENNKSINKEGVTHIISDLKIKEVKNFLEKNKVNGSAEIVHFQWMADSINMKKLLPVGRYSLGKELPVHKNWFYEEDERNGKENNKEIELAKAMMSNKQNELYEEVKKRVGN